MNRHSTNAGHAKLAFSLLVITAIVVADASRAWAGIATLSVSSTPEQTFKAFGFSITSDKNPWVRGRINNGNREAFDQETFNDLNVGFVRWWFTPGGLENLRTFKNGYVVSGVTADARSHGVRQFLLAPDRFPPDTGSGETITNVNLYAETLADNIKYIKDNFGVTMDVTGIMNEPGAAGRKVVPQELRAPLVKAVRSELDSHGLKNVKLIAPETASCNNDALQWAKAIDADPAAAAALDGFATHSYGMAATPAVAAYVRKNGWDYWQTEAGGSEDNTAAARFLNDLNNRVTHWTYFIGPHLAPGGLALLSPSRKSFTYYYLQQLTDKFLSGTIMRHTTSSIDGGEMVYTYGQKPHLNAAAGVRPDGRWVIGVVNDSNGAKGWSGSRYYPAEDFDVTINVPELAGKGTITFNVCRTCSSDTQEKGGETTIMQNGVVKVHLRPKELVTLISQTAKGT